MTSPTRVVLGFVTGYLVLCLGVATGVSLPGNHGLRAFTPLLAFYAFGGSIEAAYNCSNKTVVVTAHDTQGSFRRTAHGTLVFKQGGNSLTTPWAFDSKNPSNDQVIATVATGSSTGTWTIYLQEDPNESTTVQIPSGACTTPTTSPTTTPTPASGSTTRPTPTPTPACPSPHVYDSRQAKCVQLGRTGLG
jgi:hypothetical protein